MKYNDETINKIDMLKQMTDYKYATYIFNKNNNNIFNNDLKNISIKDISE